MTMMSSALLGPGVNFSLSLRRVLVSPAYQNAEEIFFPNSLLYDQNERHKLFLLQPGKNARWAAALSRSYAFSSFIFFLHLQICIWAFVLSLFSSPLARVEGIKVREAGFMLPGVFQLCPDFFGHSSPWRCGCGIYNILAVYTWDQGMRRIMLVFRSLVCRHPSVPFPTEQSRQLSLFLNLCWHWIELRKVRTLKTHL